MSAVLRVEASKPVPASSLPMEKSEAETRDEINKQIDSCNQKTREQLQKLARETFEKARVRNYEEFEPWFMEEVTKGMPFVELPRTWKESVFDVLQKIRDGRGTIEDLMFYSKMATLVGFALV